MIKEDSNQMQKIYPKGFEQSPVKSFFKRQLQYPGRKLDLAVFLALCFVIIVLALFFAVVTYENSKIIPNSSITTKQVSGALANGKPIKWVKIVKLSDIKKGQKYITIPKLVTNTKVKKLSQNQVIALLNTPTQRLALNIEDRRILAISSQPQLAKSFSKSLSKSIFLAVISLFDSGEGSDNQKTQQIDISSAAVAAPQNDAEIVPLNDAEINAGLRGSGNDQPEKEKGKEPSEQPLTTNDEQLTTNTELLTPNTQDLTPNTEPLTPDIETPTPETNIQGLPLDSTTTTPTPNDEQLTTNTEPLTPTKEEFILVEYETPAPTITEQNTKDGKLVTISTLTGTEDPTTPVTNVLAHTTIPEIYKVGQENRIKIKWKNEGDRIMTFTAYDLNKNGKIDYLEWTVPHLSTQVFEIIFISKAFQLDQNREIIADIFDQVKEKDNNYATIQNGQYVRVIFEKPLQNGNDITLFAKATDAAASVAVEVYLADTDQLIATFPTITADDMYKVILQNLPEPTKEFDLRVTGSALDIDYIVDPTYSLVGYWKLDETSGTSATDSSGYGNTGTHTNSPTISSTVPTTSFSNPRSLSFDGSNDYVTMGDVAGLEVEGSLPFSTSVWFRPSASPGAEATYVLVAKGTPGSAGYAFQYEKISGNFVINISKYGVADQRVTITELTPGTWYHLAGVQSSSTIEYFVNGASQGTLANASAYNASGTNAFRIGAASNGTLQANGLIDDVRIYNRALSQTEITALAAGDHTASTWDGSSSTTYATAANWSTNAVPDPYTNVTIANVANRPVLAANESLASLTINSSSFLDLAGFNLTINDSGAFTNNGTLLIKNTETLTGFTNDTDTGTIINYGTTNITGLKTGNTYNNLILNDGMVGYWKLDETSGTSATDSSGYANTGTHTNSPTISSTVPTTSFSNPRSLSFDGTNDYVDVNAAPATTYPMTISAWVKRSTSANNAIVQIHDGSAGSAEAFRLYIDSSNKLNMGIRVSGASYVITSSATIGTSWTYVTAVFSSNTSGTLYVDGIADVTGSFSGQTPSVVNKTFIGSLRASVWPFNGLIDDVRIYNRALSAGDISNLYTTTAPAITTATTTLNSALTVNGDLTLNAGTLDTASGSNYGVNVKGSWMNNGGVFTPRSGVVTLNGTASGKELLSGGQSFYDLTVNGSGGAWTQNQNATTTNNLTITAGTLDASTSNYNLSVAGNFSNAGTYTARSGAVTMTGTDTDNTITSGGTSFYGLTINGTNGVTTVQDALIATNALTITSSTLSLGSQNLTTTGATFSNTGTMMLAGSQTLTNFTNDTDSGTVMYIGTSSQTGLKTGNTYNNLILNDGMVGYWKLDETSGTSAVDSSGYGNTGTHTNSPTISSTVPTTSFSNPRSLSFDGTNDYVDLGTGNPIGVGSAWSATAWVYKTSLTDGVIITKRNAWSTGGNQFTFGTGDSLNHINVSKNTTYYNTSIAIPTNQWTFVAASCNSSGCTLWMNGTSESTATVGVTGSGTGQPLSIGAIAGSQDYFGGRIDDVRIYNRALSDGDISNLYTTTAPAVTTATTTLNSALTVNGDLTINSGTLDTSSASAYGVNVKGNWFNNGGVFTPRSGTVTLNGTASGKELLSGGQSFYDLTLNGSGGAWTQNQNVTTTNNLTITAGTLDASTSNYGLSVGGNYSNAGTYTARSGTVTLTGTGAQTITSGGSSFYNLTQNGSAGTYTLQDTTTVSNILTNTAGTFNGGSTTMTLSGSTTPLVISGTFTPATGTISYAGASATNVTSTTYNNLTFDQSGTTFTPAGAITANNLTITAGTLAPGSNTITLSGTGTIFSNSGTYTAGTSTIAVTDTSSTSKTFAGAGGTYGNFSITGAGTGAVLLTGANTFNNFTINPPKTVTFPASVTQTIGGTFSCTGTSGNVITINSSSSGTAATLSKASGTVSCDYLSVQDSTATGGATWNPGSNSTSVSGNSGWVFNTAPSITAGPSDGSSSSTTPTNVGSAVTFTTTATDTDSNNYYLAICKTNSVTAVNSGAPTCGGGSWAISSSTVSGVQASTTYTTLSADSESNAWFAFVCDNNASSLCSSSSQSSGNSGSPFAVNHVPSFTVIQNTTGILSAGDSVLFTTTASDTDTNGATDTVTLYVCKANDFASGVCGAEGQWCNSSASSSNASCSYTVQSNDTTGTKNYYANIVDNHSFTSTSNPRSSSFRVIIASGGGRKFPPPPPQPSPIVEVINNIKKVINQITSVFNLPVAQPETLVVQIPKEAPPALQGWELFTVKTGKELGLTSIASNIESFSLKVPQFNAVLKQIGIDYKKVNDVSKLNGIQLRIPGLTQTALSFLGADIQKLSDGKAIPLVDLTDEIRYKIPTNIVFAKTAGGFIDYSIGLLFDKKGNTEQKITTVAGKPVQLIIKPENPAKRVSGFLTLKKANPTGWNYKYKNVLQRALGSVIDAIQPSPNSQSQQSLLVQKFEYQKHADGIYSAEITAPAIEGDYEVMTIIEYKDENLVPKETRLAMVVDPEGYVYRQESDGRLRIMNATVSLYWLNPETKKYELWLADKFLQKNPIITNETGRYSFLVPEGMYYLKVTAKRHFDYQSDIFSIRENNAVRTDIEMKKKNWFTDFLNWFLKPRQM